jgi:hypothetical protein
MEDNTEWIEHFGVAERTIHKIMNSGFGVDTCITMTIRQQVLDVYE